MNGWRSFVVNLVRERPRASTRLPVCTCRTCLCVYLLVLARKLVSQTMSTVKDHTFIKTGIVPKEGGSFPEKGRGRNRHFPPPYPHKIIPSPFALLPLLAPRSHIVARPLGPTKDKGEKSVKVYMREKIKE